MKSIKEQMNDCVTDIKLSLAAIDDISLNDLEEQVELAEHLNIINEAADKLASLLKV